MMEEVSDDTNGESTFEFVGKSDDVLLRDQVEGDGKQSETPVLHSILTPLSFPEYTPNSPIFLPTEMPPMTTSTSSKRDEQNPLFTSPPQFNKSLQQAAAPPPYVVSPMQNQFVSVQKSPQLSKFEQLYQSPSSQTVQPQIFVPDFSVALPLSDNEGVIPSMVPESNESGVWGWIKNTQFLHKVAEKAKSSVDSVITTLDPGMKEIINTGGDINIIVASGNEAKVSPVREAFQLIFGKATVQGIPVQSSSIAPQPVGFSAGLKAAEERIGNLRQQGFVQLDHVMVAVENFITELTPENWFDMGCLLLEDFTNGITLQVYTQATPVSSHFVQLAKDQTPADYSLGWSGHSMTIGQVVGSALGVHQSEWHLALTGVPRRDILFLASKTLAGLYKKQLAGR